MEPRQPPPLVAHVVPRNPNWNRFLRKSGCASTLKWDGLRHPPSQLPEGGGLFLLPSTDATAIAIARCSAELAGRGWRVPRCEASLVDKLSNKGTLRDHAAALGLLEYLPRHFESPETAVFPVMLKAATGEWGKNVVIVESVADIRRVVSEAAAAERRGQGSSASASEFDVDGKRLLGGNWLLQELIPGSTEYSCSMVVAGGRILDAVCTVYKYDRELYVWPAVEEISRSFLGLADIPRDHLGIFSQLLTLGFSGVCNVNYKLDHRSSSSSSSSSSQSQAGAASPLRIFEFNTRVGGDLACDVPRPMAARLFSHLEQCEVVAAKVSEVAVSAAPQIPAARSHMDRPSRSAADSVEIAEIARAAGAAGAAVGLSSVQSNKQTEQGSMTATPPPAGHTAFSWNASFGGFGANWIETPLAHTGFSWSGIQDSADDQPWTAVDESRRAPQRRAVAAADDHRDRSFPVQESGVFALSNDGFPRIDHASSVRTTPMYDELLRAPPPRYVRDAMGRDPGGFLFWGPDQPAVQVVTPAPLQEDDATTSTTTMGRVNAEQLPGQRQPTLQRASSRRPAFVICPGGGYHHLAPHEGEPAARWLASLGFVACVLRYRLPANGHAWPAAADDLTSAVDFLRSKTAVQRWNIDPGRIGVLGFSAGAHLAAHTVITTRGKKGALEAVRGLILVYPPVSDLDNVPTAALPSSPTATGTSPACYVVASTNDSVCSAKEHGDVVVEGLKQRYGLPAVTYHRARLGQHGFGVSAKWTAPCATWLAQVFQM